MQNPALLLIDLQEGLNHHQHWGGNRNHPNAEQICLVLLNFWRDKGLPIFHIRHSLKNPNSPLHQSQQGFELMAPTKPLPSETLITKDTNNAFIATDLYEQLSAQSIGTVVIVGMTTDCSVSTTARMASDLGFKVMIPSDATATFDRVFYGKHDASDVVHDITLVSLHHEFATVLTSDE